MPKSFLKKSTRDITKAWIDWTYENLNALLRLDLILNIYVHQIYIPMYIWIMSVNEHNKKK